jgi:hypothetical protein
MDEDGTKGAGETALFAGEAWFDPIEAGLRGRIRGFIEELVEQELQAALGRGRYERGGSAGHRHGHRAADQLLRTGGDRSSPRPAAGRGRQHPGVEQRRSAALRYRVARVDIVSAWSRTRGPGSCDADVLRTAELQHAVQHAGGDGHLGVLAPLGPRTQAVTDDALPSRDVGLHESSEVVSRRPLPSHATTLGDELQMSVALCRRGLSRVARHRA